MPNVNINQGQPGNPLDALLQQNHGSLYGSTGFDIENALAQSRAGTIDPRIAAMGYGHTSYDDTYQFNPSDQNIDPATGRINLNGQQFVQLAGTNIGGQGEPIDPSLVQYDPTYGLITPYSNIKPISSGYGDLVFGLAGLGLGLPTAMAALGGGGGLAAGGGSTPIDISTSDLGGLAPSGLGGTGGTEGLVGGAAPVIDNSVPAVTSGGAPVVDNSVTALGATGGMGNLGNLGRLGSIIHALTSGGTGTTGGGGMGGLMSLLGLLGLGRQGGLFGGGLGTPGGAQNVANTAADRADPWGSSGLRGQAQQALTPQVMMQLLGLNPQGLHNDITQDPGYQFALQQGTNAINVGDAAQGTLHSGNRLAELERYGTGLAAQYEGQFRQENLASLGALANMGGLSSSSPVAAGNDLISGFTGGTNLQNSGLNGILGQFLNGTGGTGNIGTLLASLGNGFTSLLQGGGSAITDFFNSLFGNTGGDGNISSDIVGGLTDFGWDSGGPL